MTLTSVTPNYAMTEDSIDSPAHSTDMERNDDQPIFSFNFLHNLPLPRGISYKIRNRILWDDILLTALASIPAAHGLCG